MRHELHERSRRSRCQPPPTAAARSRPHTLAQAADKAILELLSDKGAALTVLAPNDDAFKALLKELDVTAEVGAAS